MTMGSRPALRMRPAHRNPNRLTDTESRRPVRARIAAANTLRVSTTHDSNVSRDHSSRETRVNGAGKRPPPRRRSAAQTDISPAVLAPTSAPVRGSVDRGAVDGAAPSAAPPASAAVTAPAPWVPPAAIAVDLVAHAAPSVRRCVASCRWPPVSVGGFGRCRAPRNDGRKQQRPRQSGPKVTHGPAPSLVGWVCSRVLRHRHHCRRCEPAGNDSGHLNAPRVCRNPEARQRDDCCIVESDTLR